MVYIPLEIINMKKFMVMIQKSIEWVREHSIFQKLIIVGLFLNISQVFGQYVSVPTHYDSEKAAHHIIHGHIKMFLTDSARYVVEKKPEHYIIREDADYNFIKSRLDKVFAKGNLEYVSRTNGGYIFTIAVVDRKDETKVINYCTFHVNAWSQKITEIEILLGE